MPKNAQPETKEIRTLCLRLCACCFIWTGISLLVFAVGRLWPTDRPPAWVSSAAVLFFLALASQTTAFFLARMEPVLQRYSRFRILLICLSLMAGAFGYAAVRLKIADISVVSFIGTGNLLVFACLIGGWITGPLSRPAELIPLCLVMGLVDIFSVASGPSRKIADSIDRYYRNGMKGPVPAGDFILIKIPVPGLENAVPLFGLADWIIVAFLCAVAGKFGMNDNLAGKGLAEMKAERPVSPYFPVAAAGLTLGIFIAHYLGIFIPALPLIGMVFMGFILIRYPEARALTPSDWRLMGGTILIMGAFIGIRLLFTAAG